MLGHFWKGNVAWEDFIEANISGTVDFETDVSHCQNKNEHLNFTEKDYRYIQNYKKKQSQGHLIQTSVKTVD